MAAFAALILLGASLQSSVRGSSGNPLFVLQANGSAPQSAQSSQTPSQPAAPTPSQAPSAPATAPGQTQEAAPSLEQRPTLTTSAQNAPEMSTTDHDATLRVRSNLVLVRAVVRDAKGKAVGGLKKDDFTLYDEGKPQPVTQFTAQIAGQWSGSNDNAASGSSLTTSAASDTSSGLPERYVGLYFDDIHVTMQDLLPLRVAALRYVQNTLRAADRAGVFTSSGQLQQDFTNDHEKVAEAIRKLLPRPIYNKALVLCPDIEAYQAWLIAIANDANASGAAAREVVHCQYNNDMSKLNVAIAQANGLAQAELEQSNNEELYTLRGLDGLVRRMQTLPGERTAVLLSPGFLSRDDLSHVTDLIDRALRANVIVNAIDVRGLYTTPTTGDISDDVGIVPMSEGPKAVIENTAGIVYGEPLAQISSGTGGTLFQNNNDMDSGFRITAGTPGESYLLAFIPPPSKKGGEYHKLTVKLASTAPKGYQVQARPGYFANKQTNSQASAEEEIAEAVYSQQSYDELPMDVHTRFYTADAGGKAVLSVMAHLDTRALRFHRLDGRNLDNLTLVTALFDSGGNYLKGQEKSVEFHLRDETRAKLESSGITLKSSFDVTTGRYVVRSVLRDANGPALAAASRTVEIP